MTQEPGIVDVMIFYFDFFSWISFKLGDHGWAWIVGLAIVFFILTVDRRRPRS